MTLRGYVNCSMLAAAIILLTLELRWVVIPLLAVLAAICGISLLAARVHHEDEENPQ